MKEVIELLKEHFGIENATLRRVEGYGGSINYQVDTAEGQKFVYKHACMRAFLEPFIRNRARAS